MSLSSSAVVSWLVVFVDVFVYNSYNTRHLILTAPHCHCHCHCCRHCRCHCYCFYRCRCQTQCFFLALCFCSYFSFLSHSQHQPHPGVRRRHCPLRSHPTSPNLYSCCYCAPRQQRRNHSHHCPRCCYCCCRYCDCRCSCCCCCCHCDCEWAIMSACGVQEGRRSEKGREGSKRVKGIWNGVHAEGLLENTRGMWASRRETWEHKEEKQGNKKGR